MQRKSWLDLLLMLRLVMGPFHRLSLGLGLLLPFAKLLLYFGLTCTPEQFPAVSGDSA
jgi:hypothetical protein